MELLNNLKALLAYINESTGAKFTRLGDAIKHLVEEYKSKSK